MPESNGTRKRGRAWTLSDACEIGQLVTIRCQFCRITRHYLPEDLRILLGDAGLEQVERRVRCEGCGLKDYLVVAFHFPTAEERASMRIRSLAGIRISGRLSGEMRSEARLGAAAVPRRRAIGSNSE